MIVQYEIMLYTVRVPVTFQYKFRLTKSDRGKGGGGNTAISAPSVQNCYWYYIVPYRL